MLHSICQQIWKTQQWPKDWKRSVFIPIPKKGNAKEYSNYHTIALISHTSKVMLKILQARLQRLWTVNFQTIKLDLEKAEESDIKLPTYFGSSKKQENSRKTSISALLIMLKLLTVQSTINCGKFFKSGDTRPPYLPPEKLYAGQEKTVRLGHGTTDWLQIGKGAHQGCILSPCLFNFYAEYILQNAWLESRLLGEISITSDMQMTPPLWQKVKKN